MMNSIQWLMKNDRQNTRNKENSKSGQSKRTDKTKGRTPLFLHDKESADKFLSAIRLGVSYKSACEYAGYSESSFYEWKQKAEGKYSAHDNYDREVYAEFMDTVKRTEQSGKISLLTMINKDETWQSKAWILERRFPEEFGRIDRMEVTGKDGGVIKQESVNYNTELTLEEAKQLDSDSLLALVKD